MLTGEDRRLGSHRRIDAEAVLTVAGTPFSEVSAHRASLEEAYMELTREAVEFRAVAP